jgi:hypothetical protein
MEGARVEWFYLRGSTGISPTWWWGCAIAASILIASIVMIFRDAFFDPEWWRNDPPR